MSKTLAGRFARRQGFTKLADQIRDGRESLVRADFRASDYLRQPPHERSGQAGRKNQLSRVIVRHEGGQTLGIAELTNQLADCFPRFHGCQKPAVHRRGGKPSRSFPADMPHDICDDSPQSLRERLVRDLRRIDAQAAQLFDRRAVAPIGRYGASRGRSRT